MDGWGWTDSGKMGSMRVILIRHGESQNNRIFAETGGEAGRSPDPGLTDLGHAQAVALAGAVDLLPWRPTHVYSSLMLRALQTAAPLADALNLPLLARTDIHEGGGPNDRDADGAWVTHPGSPRDVLAAVSPRVVLPPEAGPDGWYPGPLEEPDGLGPRAAQAVASLLEEHSDDDVIAVVTHGWFSQHLVRTFLGIPSMTGWIEIKNTGLTLLHNDSVTFEDGEVALWIAERINWLPHLRDDQISV